MEVDLWPLLVVVVGGGEEGVSKTADLISHGSPSPSPPCLEARSLALFGLAGLNFGWADRELSPPLRAGW